MKTHYRAALYSQVNGLTATTYVHLNEDLISLYSWFKNTLTSEHTYSDGPYSGGRIEYNCTPWDKNKWVIYTDEQLQQELEHAERMSIINTFMRTGQMREATVQEYNNCAATPNATKKHMNTKRTQDTEHTYMGKVIATCTKILKHGRVTSVHYYVNPDYLT